MKKIFLLFLLSISIYSLNAQICQAWYGYQYNPTNTTVYFTDNSYNLDSSLITVTAWQWTFGDGTSATTQTPQHIYNSIGTYYVCLTITTNTGCTSTFCDSVNAGTQTACNPNFTYYPDSSCSTCYWFYDASTGSPTSWLWNFGDGTTSTLQNPYHAFTTTGTYTVSLITCLDTMYITIVVGSTNNCLLYATYTTIAESATGASDGSIDLTVYGGTAPYSYSWDNGATTEDINNLSEGYYNVSVIDSTGCTTFASVYVADSSLNYTPIGTLSNITQDTCLAFPYDSIFVYAVNVIDSFTVDVVWAFLEVSTGTIAYLTETYTLSNQGYYTVTIAVTCNPKKSTNTYNGHIYMDYNDVPSSIKDNNLLSNNLELYPIPFDNVLNIKFTSTGSNQIKLSILNLMGQVIYNNQYNVIKGLNNIVISTDKLSSGIYFVKVYNENNKIITQKIVK